MEQIPDISEPTPAPAPAEENSRFNISRWALQHPALTRYLMVVLLIMGSLAYF